MQRIHYWFHKIRWKGGTEGTVRFWW